MNKVILFFKPQKLNIKIIEETCKKAYELSCHGDFKAVDLLRVIDTVDTFYIYQCALETILHNLNSYKDPKITERRQDGQKRKAD